MFTSFFTINIYRKNAPPTGGHVFLPITTIFKLVRDNNKNNANIVISRVFTREKCPAYWRPYIKRTNVLINFHDDWANIVTSRVFTSETAPPTFAMLFNGSESLLNSTKISLRQTFGQNFIGLKLLTKFHEDGTRNVASRVFTCKC
ncbi:hypothetical protein DPMN_049363 [Dreissena polymorpha]|uniref:Uncharacterized protein n=1 Tax=Dreissena polymorpha TaxID=45954 RepID=A0A9D4CET1_DREPO|nr:hypothetical protein DPMN_049363 [Dreissena polymorpha]